MQAVGNLHGQRIGAAVAGSAVGDDPGHAFQPLDQRRPFVVGGVVAAQADHWRVALADAAEHHLDVAVENQLLPAARARPSSADAHG